MILVRICVLLLCNICCTSLYHVTVRPGSWHIHFAQVINYYQTMDPQSFHDFSLKYLFEKHELKSLIKYAKQWM